MHNFYLTIYEIFNQIRQNRNRFSFELCNFKSISYQSVYDVTGLIKEYY